MLQEKEMCQEGTEPAKGQMGCGSCLEQLGHFGERVIELLRGSVQLARFFRQAALLTGGAQLPQNILLGAAFIEQVDEGVVMPLPKIFSPLLLEILRDFLVDAVDQRYRAAESAGKVGAKTLLRLREQSPESSRFPL